MVAHSTTAAAAAATATLRKPFVHHMCQRAMTKRKTEATARKNGYFGPIIESTVVYLMYRLIACFWVKREHLICCTLLQDTDVVFAFVLTLSTFIKSALNNNEGRGRVRLLEAPKNSPFCIFRYCGSETRNDEASLGNEH